MKTYSIIATFAAAAASLLAFSAPAAAQEATYEYPQPIVSAKSRAEVKAELAQARADGLILAGEASETRYNAAPAPSRAAPVLAAKPAKPAKASKAAAGERVELVPTQFEPHSFDGSVTVADGGVARRVR